MLQLRAFFKRNFIFKLKNVLLLITKCKKNLKKSFTEICNSYIGRLLFTMAGKICSAERMYDFMKKTFVMIAAILGFAAAATVDNLIFNGEFEKIDAKGKALAWNLIAPKTAKAEFFATGAPDGGFARITVPETCEFSLRQSITNRVTANTKYELSFWVRGVNFKGERLGVLLINDNWKKSAGIRNIKPTAEWVKHKMIVTMPEFEKYAGLVFYGTKAQGTVEIADVELELPDND